MLSALIWIPIVGAAIVGFWPSSGSSPLIRRVALTIATAIALLSLYVTSQFNTVTAGLQFPEFHAWLPQLGLTYSLSTDGLSLPLVGLSALLTWIAILSTRADIQRPRLYFSLILLANAGLAGAFLAQNLLLFILFYELELIPFYLLIAIWGGSEKRGYAATKFLIYTAVSGILVLAAFLGMAWFSGANSFDYTQIHLGNVPLNTRLILLTFLLIGFGIKIPLVPLHTWLPDAYVESSPPVTILLGGIMAKLGTYGLLRFGLQLFPEAWNIVAPGLATIGVVSVMYGALVAIAQRDIKRMVAYSSIGHMGYILVAAAAYTPLSMLGGVAQMVSHGLILAILFYLVGMVEAKVGTRDLDKLNGLMSPVRGLPLTSALLILAGMASAGIPGMVGFVAEYMVFQGSFTTYPIITLLCIIASGLTAVYFVILLNRTCFGRLDSHTAYYPNVRFAEHLPALILTGIILFLGIQPYWLIHWVEPTTEVMVTQLEPARATRLAIAPTPPAPPLAAPTLPSPAWPSPAWPPQ